MSTLFEDRERAAEYGFAHSHELRFLSLREATEALARWAAEELGETPEAGADYAAALIGRLVRGADEADLVAQVRQDVEARGGSGEEVGHRFAQALAEASDRLHGRLPPHFAAVAREPVRPIPHAHGFWGWTV